jgi:TolB-like protein/DNA-binding SARP family transcriptional activator
VLRLLGGAALITESGRVTGPAAHRHPIALLALLATAPSASMRREKLVTLLWPESGQQDGRHSLNVAVHTLRKVFGENVVRSVGGDLQLDLSILPCDVAEYTWALSRGDYAAAVARYRGPFMDGFYLDGAEEFERWQEAERARLCSAYAHALTSTAEAMEGSNDWQGAVEAWRRLAAIDPGKTRVAARLMTALENAGDRAGALQVADAHAALMQREYDAEPDPEIIALAQRIRDRPVGVPLTPARQRPSFVPASESAPGETGTASVQAAHGVRRRRRLWLGSGASVVFVIGAIALGIKLLATPESTGAVSPVPAASVAVLPFVNMSADTAHQYLSDGLTEELINALARVHGLRVAARTSAFQFRGRDADVRDIGRRLNVTAVIEGSVRASGDRLRITAQLIDARSGYHIWSDEFDRPAQDVFAVQEDIAQAVTRALRVQLAQRIRQTIVSAGTSSAEAHDLYLRGRFEWNKRTEEGMLAAKEAFERALAIDPRYASAYAGLSDAWQLLPLYGHVPTKEALANAKTAALRAIALDSMLAEAHTALAVMHLEYDLDRDAAEKAYRRAIEINPGYATAHHWFALFLVAGGRVEEAIAQAELARRVDPLSRIIHAAVGTVRMFARDYEAALAEFRAILAHEPEWATAQALLGRALASAGRYEDAIGPMETAVELSKRRPSHVSLLAYAMAMAGRTNEARALLDELEEAPPGSFAPPVDLAAVYVALGRPNEAFRILNRGVDERDEEMMYMKVDPRYDPVRRDPRFDRLLERLDLR